VLTSGKIIWRPLEPRTKWPSQRLLRTNRPKHRSPRLSQPRLKLCHDLGARIRDIESLLTSLGMWLHVKWRCRFLSCKGRCEASSSGCRWFFHLLFARCRSSESECRCQEKLNQRCPRCTCSRPSRSLLLAYSHLCRCFLRRLMYACPGLCVSIHWWAWRCHWQCHIFKLQG